MYTFQCCFYSVLLPPPTELKCEASIKKCVLCSISCTYFLCYGVYETIFTCLWFITLIALPCFDVNLQLPLSSERDLTCLHVPGSIFE